VSRCCLAIGFAGRGVRVLSVIWYMTAWRLELATLKMPSTAEVPAGMLAGWAALAIIDVLALGDLQLDAGIEGSPSQHIHSLCSLPPSSPQWQPQYHGRDVSSHLPPSGPSRAHEHRCEPLPPPPTPHRHPHPPRPKRAHDPRHPSATPSTPALHSATSCPQMRPSLPKKPTRSRRCK
jgi:hypothetical protein